VNLSNFYNFAEKRKHFPYHEGVPSSSRKEEFGKEYVSDRKFWGIMFQAMAEIKHHI